VRQFLDLGSGLPTTDNVHEVAQAVAPSSHVVYVDNDPLVLAHARALLTSTPEGRTAYVQADIRSPASILSSPTMRDSDVFASLAFSGLELVPPGVVLVSDWRPISADVPRPTPAEVSCYGGVARKP
jgi:hypothetical protein